MENEPSEQKTCKDQTRGGGKKKVTMPEGVSQGRVQSPTLFIIFINDLPKPFAPYIHRALHANDLAIWTQSEHTEVSARIEWTKTR